MEAALLGTSFSIFEEGEKVGEFWHCELLVKTLWHERNRARAEVRDVGSVYSDLGLRPCHKDQRLRAIALDYP